MSVLDNNSIVVITDAFSLVQEFSLYEPFILS